MTPNLITPSKSLGYTDIYLGFLAGIDPPKHLYPATSLEDVAGKLDRINYDRPALVDILKKQNTRCGASPKTFENIEKLADPRTVCVFAGQQAGFLGGPLFTIIKAVGIVKAAQLYTQQLGRPVIPIFWVAGDDHDFEEVNHAYVLDRDTEVREIAYKTPPEKQVSTAYIRFADQEELARAKGQLRENLGDTDFTPELYDLIDRTYTSEETFVSAFGKLMSSFMRDTGLILFCPGDEDAKKFGAPFTKMVIERQDALQAAIGAANDEITGLGYHLQVEKKDNAAHLFYDLDGRKPVMRDGDDFTVGDRKFTREELLALADEQPERFSPDVLTRPIFQSYLFPTISQKSGPAELAYLAQVHKAFELFERPVPVYHARPTVTIVEKRFEKMIQQYDINFEDLTGDIEQVVNRVLAKTFPENLETHVEQLKKDVEERFERFVKESLEFDPSLRDFGRQIYGKIDYNLKAFEGKVFSSHKKKSLDTRERIYRVWHALFPNRGLQERTINLTYFISKYGFDFITFLADRMDSEETSHQLLNLSEWDN